jgi:hypothetical protein
MTATRSADAAMKPGEKRSGIVPESKKPPSNPANCSRAVWAFLLDEEPRSLWRTRLRACIYPLPAMFNGYYDFPLRMSFFTITESFSHVA